LHFGTSGLAPCSSFQLKKKSSLCSSHFSNLHVGGESHVPINPPFIFISLKVSPFSPHTSFSSPFFSPTSFKSNNIFTSTHRNSGYLSSNPIYFRHHTPSGLPILSYGPGGSLFNYFMELVFPGKVWFLGMVEI
jgi:hypothetical protein